MAEAENAGMEVLFLPGGVPNRTLLWLYGIKEISLCLFREIVFREMDYCSVGSTVFICVCVCIVAPGLVLVTAPGAGAVPGTATTVPSPVPTPGTARRPTPSLDLVPGTTTATGAGTGAAPVASPPALQTPPGTVAAEASPRRQRTMGKITHRLTMNRRRMLAPLLLGRVATPQRGSSQGRRQGRMTKR